MALNSDPVAIKKLGLRIKSFKLNGERVYAVRG